MLKKSTLLSVSVFFLLFSGVSDYGYGHHRPGHGGGLGGGGGGDEVLYDVTISDDVTSHNNVGGSTDIWTGPNPSPKSIGTGFRDGHVFELDMSYFTNFFEDRGTSCFGTALVQLFPQAFLQRGGGGRAEAHLWFGGCTDEGRTPPSTGDCNGDDVLYVLKLFGLFDPNPDWPPTILHQLTMTDWVIEREGHAVVSHTCLDGEEGNAEFQVLIDVTPLP